MSIELAAGRSVAGTIGPDRSGPERDWIAGWRRPGDAFEWVLEVPIAGRFELEVAYGATDAVAGTKLQIRVGERLVGHRIVPTHDSRVFRSVTLGSQALTAGRSRMRVAVTTPVEAGSFKLHAIRLRRL